MVLLASLYGGGGLASETNPSRYLYIRGHSLNEQAQDIIYMKGRMTVMTGEFDAQLNRES